MSNFDPHGTKASIVLLILWVAHGCLAEDLPADQPHGNGLQVVCSLEQPVVWAQGQVSAAVLVAAPKGSRVRYLWTATAGGFVAKPGSQARLNKQGDEATVQWSPNGAAPGVYTVTVQVTNATGASGSCSLDALVKEKKQRRDASDGGELGSEAARALLVKGRTERKGYGLYSYILFAARPDASNSDRFHAVLKSYLNLENVNLEANFRLAQLNVTYVPVTAAPQEDPPTLSSFLAQYDYSRARFLLASLPREEGDGPFIVSSVLPLQGPGTETGPYIIQNLSTVPVSVIPLWMKQFRSQTTQQRVWERKTIGNMALELRTAIAIAAEGLPMVQKAVSSLIVITPTP